MSVFPSDVGGRRSRQDGNQPRVGKRPHGSVCKCVPGGRQHTCSGGDPDDLRERKQFIIFRATTLGMSIRAGGTHPGISNYDSPPPPHPEGIGATVRQKNKANAGAGAGLSQITRGEFRIHLESAYHARGGCSRKELDLTQTTPRQGGAAITPSDFQTRDCGAKRAAAATGDK